MNKKKKLIPFFILIIIILIVWIFVQSKQISSITKENLDLKNETERLNSNLDKVQEEVQSNLNLINEYTKEIQSSMSWFKDNSILGETWREKQAKNELINMCYSSNSDTCFINLACFYLMNDHFIGLKYKTDIETSFQEDKLQSLENFSLNGGGDCEDYSLFYKAEYNYLFELCGEKKINLESVIFGEDITKEFYLNNQKTWYINGEGKILSEGYIYPNIICGNIYDLETQLISGHCVIAFTKKEILSISDLKELDLSPIIEPQNGGYMGLINDASSEIYLLKENQESYPNSYIYEIITNNDLFFFKEENKSWQSYAFFYNILNKQKETLIALN